MNQLLRGGKKYRAVSTVVGAAAALALFATGARAATTYGVTNNNSVVTLTPGASGNMSSWTVGGQNILSQQSFYYRVGSGNNISISTIPLTSVTPGGNTIDALYTASTFSINILYSLVGGSASSGASDLSEQISIQNLTSSTLVGFHFYQYASFIGAGNVDISQNSRGLFNEAYVANGTMSVSESVDTALTPANQAETDANALANLLGTANYNPNGSTTSTSGDWVMGWSDDIAANGTLILSKDLGAMVPEPPAWALLSIGLGFGAIVMYRRRPRTTPAPVRVK